MDDEKIFKENKNPFDINGTMGRLCFLNYSVLFFFLTGMSIFLYCPTLSKTTATPELSNNKTIIEMLLSELPNEEVAVYILTMLVYMVLMFVLNKKRILAILGDTPHAVKCSYIYAFVLLLLSFQLNFTIPQGSSQASFLALGSVCIFIFLILKKGNVDK